MTDQVPDLTLLLVLFAYVHVFCFTGICLYLGGKIATSTSYVITRITDKMGKLSLVVRKPVFGVSDHVWHKLGCRPTEDGSSLEILYLGSRGIVLAV